MVESAINLLVSGQNSDGGWGWTKGRNSTTECTSLALLAMMSVNDDQQASTIRRGLNWLVKRQNADGSWPLSDSLPFASWATAMAMLALDFWPAAETQVIRGGKWALKQHGSKPGILANLILTLSFKKKPVMLNEDLIGWPWTTGTFSWVEPTSYFLIVLKRIRQQLVGTNVDERIRQGESMIYDRMCDGGGWNYGNSVVYGEKLWPYPDITAIALIALQDHHDAIKKRVGLASLQDSLNTVTSGLALSWSAICYDIYGRDFGNVRKLLDRGFETTGFLGETKSLALYILALTGGARYFRI